MTEAINLDAGLTTTKKFKVRVNAAGELRPEEPGRWIALWQSLKGKVVEVAVTKPKRSNEANAYWHAVVVPLATELLSVGRALPFSEVTIHYKLVEVFGAAEDTELGRVSIRSSHMNTEEFYGLTTNVREWMLHKHGVVCPTPDDYWAERAS